VSNHPHLGDQPGDAEFRRSPSATPIVLGLLATTPEPQHGYALFRRIQQDLRDVWSIGMNRLYTLLAEMEGAGLIGGHVEKPGRRPARRVFKLLPKGRRTFKAWMAEPIPHMRDMRVEFLPKLYFARQVGPAAMADLIRSQRAACERGLERMTALQQERGFDDMYVFLVYEFRIRQIQSMLRWLDECEHTLATSTPHTGLAAAPAATPNLS
jgi:DNA-binding PadR family transcriptional regulator